MLWQLQSDGVIAFLPLPYVVMTGLGFEMALDHVGLVAMHWSKMKYTVSDSKYHEKDPACVLSCKHLVPA